jgi:hypothetical protein
MDLPEGKPERPESPGEQGILAGENISGWQIGKPLLPWDEPVEALVQSRKVLQESAGTERLIRKGQSITGEEQSSEGRSP